MHVRMVYLICLKMFVYCAGSFFGFLCHENGELPQS